VAWDQKEITAYLVDVDTGDYLDFQYNPNDIVDEKSTAYAAIKIPGMSHRVVTWEDSLSVDWFGGDDS